MTGASIAVQPLNPLHPRVIGLGATLLIAAFASDLIYWWTVRGAWETLSIWLLTVGLIVAALSGLALVIDVLRGQAGNIQWGRFLALAAAALLSLLNAFVHSRDGYTAVVPQGLALSAIVTIILLVVGRRGWRLDEPRS